MEGTVVSPIVDAAAGEIANDFISFIKRQIGYLIHYNNNIVNLQQELQKLEDENTGVIQCVDAAKRKFEEIAPKVFHWQEKVVPVIQNVRIFLGNEVEGNNNKCLKGMCPDVKSRYSLSRKAMKMAMEIGTLCQEALNFGPISYPAPPPKMGSTFITHGVRDYESRKLIMNGVWEALNDDDVCMTSIFGMGGVGKTTMVKKLVQRIEGENLYDKIVMTVVSQNPDLVKIQSEIIEQLGLKIEEKTLTVRSRMLSDWFMNDATRTSTLLILDDVWQEMDFEAIGIPSSFEKVKGYKILLTSRNKNVCNSLGSQRNFEIKVLENREASDLFTSVVGHFVDQDLHDTTKEIVAECGGLPIAIVTIAGALKNKPEYAWNDALRQLKKSNLKGISGMEKVYSRIEISYNYLKLKEAKSCFLLCSLFAEDSNVPVESLVRYGMGLRLFENVDDFHQARDKVNALIDELRDSFLLLDGDVGRKSVKMHDVIRDTAILIASKDEKYVVNCDSVMKRWPEADRCKGSTAMSIICSDLTELPIHDMECPMLQLLRLDYSSSSRDQINKMFRGMKQLQVLNLEIRSLPNSLDFPKNLRSLCLLIRNLESGELPKEIGALTSLEILEITSKRYVKKLPKEIAFLGNLRLLDLGNIHSLGHIPSGVLSKLLKLEELYVTWDFYKWECKGDGEETNASLRELDCLPLTALKIRVPNFSILPHKSIFRKLIKFKILTGRPRIFRNVLENMLCIEGGVDIKESGICSLLRKTEGLRLQNVVNLKSISELSDDVFPQLRVISIEYCNELEYIADATILQETLVTGFSKLESIELTGLQNLKEIWHGLISNIKPLEIQLPRFNCLQSIDISLCEKLEYVFPLSVARGMRQLQKMQISDCENMEGIFYKEEVDDEKITANEVEFPNLKNLALFDLPKLKRFWVDTQVMADSMEQPINASNANAQAISTFFPSPNFLRLSNLQALSLRNCCPLKVAFAASAAQQLVQLKSLAIWGCEKMEYVVGVADGRQEETVFPMLNKLRLMDLSKLVAFCADDHVSLYWHSIKKLKVEKCPKLKTSGLVRRGREKETIEAQNKHLFSNKEVSSSVGHVDDHSAFPFSLIERLQNLEKIRIEECDAFEVIFSFQEHHAVAVGVVNSLRRIYLDDLRNLTHIWFKIPSEIMGFQSLEDLTIYNCENLIHIFPPHLPKLLVKLEYIWVDSCEKMKAIVGKEDKEVSESAMDKIVFPQLIYLRLIRLPNLESFNAGTNAVELPLLEDFEVDGCKQIENYYYDPSSKALKEDLSGTMKNKVMRSTIFRIPSAIAQEVPIRRRTLAQDGLTYID